MSSASRAIPQSFNLYAYVQNNPVDLIDPSGLNEEAPIQADPTFAPYWDWGFWWWRMFNNSPTRGGGITETGGGGGSVNQQQEKTPCARMAGVIRTYFDFLVNAVGGTEAFLNSSHSELNEYVRGLDMTFSLAYLGVPHLDSWSVANEMRGKNADNIYRGSWVRSGNLDVHGNQFLGQEDFHSDYQEMQEPLNIPIPDTDQTHHFAAYFSAGINNLYGGATIHEVADFFGGAGLADAALGHAAYNIGASLHQKQKWDPKRKTWIENPRDRAQRLLNLANTVESSICR